MLDAPAILKSQNSFFSIHKIISRHLQELGFHVEIQDNHNKRDFNTEKDTNCTYHSSGLHNGNATELSGDVSKLCKTPDNLNVNSKLCQDRNSKISKDKSLYQTQNQDLRISSVGGHKLFSVDQSEHLSESSDGIFLKTDEIIIVFNKCDLLENGVAQGSTSGFSVVWVSCITRSGVTEFVNLLTQKVKQM